MLRQTLTVTEENSQVRLDIFLAQNLADVPSRTFVKRLIDNGHVLVNQKPPKAHDKVEPGDNVVVEIPAADPEPDVKAEKISLNIFYEDGCLLIVNKPAGMLVHPVHGYHSGTLVNALMHHCKSLSSINTSDENEERQDAALIRPGIVHRLDRETSGLMVVAKDNATHVDLARQFERHKVKKRYVALVKGHVEFDEGVIDVPLGRHPRHWDKKAVSFEETAKAATTYYRVLKRFDREATLIALFPKSGRTHQLRVHMAHLGHPILGDDKYGGAELFPRLALHAQAIGFFHPRFKIFVEFFSMIPREFFPGGLQR